MIQIDKFNRYNYTLIVDGNGGEEQLIVTAASGQNGETVVAATATSVDLGMKNMLPYPGRGYIIYVETSSYPSLIREILCRWTNLGNRPTEQERIREDATIEQIMKLHFKS